MIVKIKTTLSVIICIIVLSFSTIPAFADTGNWYAGTYKGEYTYYGISAYIKTPSSLPSLGDSGESCWVSAAETDGDWIQSGLRYYSGYSGFKTYVETVIGGVHNLTEYGTHLLDTNIRYKVDYNFSDQKWHAYIADFDKESHTMDTTHRVSARGESHCTSTTLGPFNFSSVVYKKGDYDWAWMDVQPYSDSPYSVSYTNYYTYQVYGP